MSILEDQAIFDNETLNPQAGQKAFPTEKATAAYGSFIDEHSQAKPYGNGEVNELANLGQIVSDGDASGVFGEAGQQRGGDIVTRLFGLADKLGLGGLRPVDTSFKQKTERTGL